MAISRRGNLHFEQIKLSNIYQGVYLRTTQKNLIKLGPTSVSVRNQSLSIIDQIFACWYQVVIGSSTN